MKSDKLELEIKECIVRADFAELVVLVPQLVKTITEFEASKKLSEILYKEYTPYKSGYLAKVLEVIISINRNLAIINHPENFLYKAVIITGSADLYDCYLEEAVQPFLALVVPEEHEIHYMELLGTAQTMSDFFFDKYPLCVKGMDYNGAFSGAEDNENILLINREDYETMEDVVTKYNTIIGRKNIIKDLTTRAGLNF